MSIVMHRIQPYDFDRGGGGGGGGSIFTADPEPSPAAKCERMLEAEEGGCWLSSPSVSSASSSSIGRDSDADDEDDNSGKSLPDSGDSGENEAESPYKGPLDMMESLEEVLPVRRGISKFYNGKSKSFTSLSAALSSSTAAKEISKPENLYSRRRRNLLSHHLWDNKNRSCCSRGGISKKPITNTMVMSSSKSSLALAMAAAAAITTGSGDDSLSLGSSPTTSGSPPSPTPTRTLPPLHPPPTKGSFGNLTPARGGGLCAWRSCSVVDLRRYFPAVAGGSGGS